MNEATIMKLSTRTYLRRLLFLFAAFFGGCATQPVGDSLGEIRKSTTIPKAWMFAASNEATQKQQDWWRSFHSAELNTLVDQALAHNQDLAAAGYEWRKAMLALDTEKLDRKPSFSGTTGVTRNHDFSRHTVRVGYSLGISASYQLDIWRKLAASDQIAAWKADASAEDLLATRLTLTAAVANAYFDVLHIGEKLALNEKHRRYQQRTIDMMRSKYEAGETSYLSLVTSEKALTTLEQTRNTLQSEHKQAQNRLSILLGRPPQPFSFSAQTLKTLTLTKINAGIPAAILQRRPDLRAAQYRLQADLGDIQVSTLDFYPKFSLTADFGSRSDRLLRLLRNPVGELAATISLPFLDYHKHSLTLKSAQIQYQADLARFRQTLYRAFADVENALLALKTSEDNAAILKRKLAQAREIERLTDIRHQAGADPLQDLLDARQARRDVESALLDNRHQRLTRRVALCLALGGSSETPSGNDNGGLLSPP